MSRDAQRLEHLLVRAQRLASDMGDEELLLAVAQARLLAVRRARLLRHDVAPELVAATEAGDPA